jgi:hypothetical protein
MSKRAVYRWVTVGMRGLTGLFWSLAANATVKA